MTSPNYQLPSPPSDAVNQRAVAATRFAEAANLRRRGHVRGAAFNREGQPTRPKLEVVRSDSPLNDQRLAANAKGEVTLRGLASATGKPYVMYDFFGPYEEVVAPGAFERTLEGDPLVLFTVNHEGLGLASTKSGDLTLTETDEGLVYEATMPLADPDVYALASKVDRGVVTESSFMFRIDDAQWDDRSERFTILEVDLERGDVAAVMYGANPNTDIAKRVDGVSGAAEAAAAARRAAVTPDEVEVSPPISLETQLSRLALERIA